MLPLQPRYTQSRVNVNMGRGPQEECNSGGGHTRSMGKCVSRIAANVCANITASLLLPGDCKRHAISVMSSPQTHPAHSDRRSYRHGAVSRLNGSGGPGSMV
jgi:hypothetical protein